MRILIVVQARMGSSRLPGKVMRPLAGEPLLLRLIERLRAVRLPCRIVVATTRLEEDEPIRQLCRAARVDCLSGHPTDLLDRHYQAALRYDAQAVVKIPSDCPLIDPAAVDRVVGLFVAAAGRYDYVSNLHPASWPDGNDVEVVTMAALRTAWREGWRPHEREHTTPFLWDQPERFRLGNEAWNTGRDASLSHRFTVDYPEDYALAAAVYEALWRPTRPVFGTAEILGLLEARHDLLALNAHLAGVNWYRHHLGVLRTVDAAHTRMPPEAA
jgi:spore coat polysaccharide biosynthesis protein SpsF